MGLFGSLFGGGRRSRPPEKPTTSQFPTMTPGQKSTQENLLGQVPGLIGELRQPSQPFDFAPIEQQARTSFESQTIPGLAERFTAMGGGGQRSSAFQGALGQAGSTLEENLAALRSNVGMQQQQQETQKLLGLLGPMLSAGFKSPFETMIQQPTPQGPNVGAQMFGRGLAGLGGAGLGYMAGGPAGLGLGALRGLFG